MEEHHPNASVFGVDGFVVLAAALSHKDGCYDVLHVFNYKAGELLRSITFNGTGELEEPG